MSGRLTLENFQKPDKPKSRASVPEELEKQMLAAFENGYKAGWDDAVKTQRKDRAHISADFARNIQSVSFTYHEVQSQIMQSVEQLLQDVVEKILPQTAAAMLGQTVVEVLRPMVEAAVDAPVELVVHPENRPTLVPLVNDALSLPVTVVEENSLGVGQVFLRIGKIEKSIDLDEVLGSVKQAIDGFFDPQDTAEKEHSNVG